MVNRFCFKPRAPMMETGNVGNTAGNANVNVDPTNHVTLTNNQTATGAIVVNGNVANHTTYRVRTSKVLRVLLIS